ncbi:MAG TPA: sigma-70 family RNA polymerase sigma factor [Candidatus Limnocylindrales bacterium]|nr:sigma-70 family RNA polymerase sigma factor [Candidatus Limnocylindrales bacterium]
MTDIATEPATLDGPVQRAARGDEAAFATLVSEHHASMARVAFVICGDAETTRDAVQSAWAIAWRRIGSVRDPSQIRAWLVAVAANEARQAVRRQRRVRYVDVADAASLVGDDDPADRITVVDLRRVLRGLNADDRALLALRYVAGLDSTEIAAHLGGSASGVRSRLARLLDRLRIDLDHDGASR